MEGDKKAITAIKMAGLVLGGNITFDAIVTIWQLKETLTSTDFNALLKVLSGDVSIEVRDEVYNLSHSARQFPFELNSNL